MCRWMNTQIETVKSELVNNFYKLPELYELTSWAFQSDVRDVSDKLTFQTTCGYHESGL